MKIGIIGAGNIGTALAADLGRNNGVRLYSSHPEDVKKHINYFGENGKRFKTELELSTNNIMEIINGVEIVFMAIPTFLIKKMLDKLLPILNPEVVIGFVPGAGG